ncbi:MAG: putative Na+/H+ antiporter [Opitutaceae bacterium]|nr:putative Na+/H+ antiporter [Opitutaceae bacterium]
MIKKSRVLLWLLPALLAFGELQAATPAPDVVLPVPLNAYQDAADAGVLQVLQARMTAEPFNVAASLIFLLAVVHTFLTAKFRHWAHAVEAAHHEKLKLRRENMPDSDEDGWPDEVSFKGQVLHFLGEVEAVFGLWVLVLAGAITWFKGWDTMVHYIGEQVNFTEPMFVVIIMAMASTRPVLSFAERCMRAVASLGRGSAGAWWLSIMILAPILGSFITEPAAMTIAALLLARQFYELKPSPKFAYATLGLLFVSISVGGTLTHFAAPPVLMVAAPWGWNTTYMLLHIGWKAVVGIVISTTLFYAYFRQELAELDKVRVQAEQNAVSRPERAVPLWITVVQLLFMALTVYFAHHPALFIGGFLFFLAFAQATAHHQNKLDLRPSLLVGFFLAGLVIHGGLQGWWIEPVLKSLGELQLFLGATILTAFNDNAAITYLATLVPGFTDELKYAVVTGAVTGGGLTVIANAPNPAGQSILNRFFPEGIAPGGLFVGALIPTIIMGFCFMLF